MSDFNPQKLSVNLITPATFTQPVEGRKYTLTHSDITAELFLDIGYIYNVRAINPQMRDEVLAKWEMDVNGRLKIAGTAYVDGGEFSSSTAGMRFNIFKREMATAIKGIVYGDRPFFVHYPLLLDAPIFIHYMSSYPQYRKILYYGTPRQYLAQIHQASLSKVDKIRRHKNR
ncbi:Staygreen protein [compost metagenome]